MAGELRTRRTRASDDRKDPLAARQGLSDDRQHPDRPDEALAVLRKIEATGTYESDRCMRSALSRVFRYGVATVRCDKDVAADLRGAIAVPKVKHFAAFVLLQSPSSPALMKASTRATDVPKLNQEAVDWS